MKLPYVLLSIAMSIDGKISNTSREKVYFSNKEDFSELEKLRRDSDGILVGSTTLKNDNPSLVLKKEISKKHRIKYNKSEEPVKIAISKLCDIKNDSNFLQRGNGRKIVFTTKAASKKDINRVSKFAEVYVHSSPKVDILELLKTIYKSGIRRLLVEGGGETNYEFLKRGVVDELRVAIAPIVIGGRTSPTFVDGDGFDLSKIINLKLKKVERFRQLIVLNYKVKKIL